MLSNNPHVAVFDIVKSFFGDSFEYGVIAARADRMTEENQGDLFNASKYASIDFTSYDYAIVEIKLSGISGDLSDMLVYLCGYVILDDKLYYLNNGICKENASAFVTSYNQISGK